MITLITLMTVIRLITRVLSRNGNILTVGVLYFTYRLQLTQQAADGVIILVKRLCHLPWTHALGKLFAEQVQDVLAFLRAFCLLSISHQHPHRGLRIEPESQLLLVLDIAASHKQVERDQAPAERLL